MSDDFDKARDALHETTIRLFDDGMIPGSSGNASTRVEKTELVAITPTSIPYHRLRPDDIVVIDLDGNVVDGAHKPSNEAGIHLAVYRARPDAGAVLHTHAAHSAALSVLREGIPPVMDEIAVYAGGPVRVAPYGAPGSPDLATKVVQTLGNRGAVLLANHGNLVVGRDLEAAYRTAHVVERAAQILCLAMATGKTIHHVPADVVALEKELYRRSSGAMADPTRNDSKDGDES